MSEIRQEMLPSEFEIKKNCVGRYEITESWDHWLVSFMGSGYTRLTVKLPGSYTFKWQARRAARYFKRHDMSFQ